MSTAQQDRSLVDRLGRLEAQLEIGQLPVRYATAVDQRDIDTWVGLFVPDVNMGRRGSGREALRDWITPHLIGFYRSIHYICGHRIVLGPAGPTGDIEAATGHVYCRAEHEVGNRWIVMGIRYDDEYRRVDGEWLFERRRERHWYAADLDEHPQLVGFDSWHPTSPSPALPGHDRHFAAFWQDRDSSSVTEHPLMRGGTREDSGA